MVSGGGKPQTRSSGSSRCDATVMAIFHEPAAAAIRQSMVHRSGGDTRAQWPSASEHAKEERHSGQDSRPREGLC